MWRTSSAARTVSPPDQLHVYRVHFDSEPFPSIATTDDDTSSHQETIPVATTTSVRSSISTAVPVKDDVLQSLPSTEPAIAISPFEDTCARKRKRGDSTETPVNWEHFPKSVKGEEATERRPSIAAASSLDTPTNSDATHCRQCHVLVDTAHQRETTLIRALQAAQEREADMTRELRRARDIQNALLDVIHGLKEKEREARREQFMAQVNKDAMRKKFEQWMATYSRREAAIREKVQGWMEDQSQTRNKLKWQAERLDKYEATLGMVFETVPELRTWIEVQMAQDET